MAINPGLDVSGNNNNWTTNNINWTGSGVTFDTMTDVPTLTSATTANYAVLNPLALGTSQTSLTQGNLYAIPTSGASNWGTSFSTIAIPTSGKYYIEATATVFTGVGNNSSLGVVDSATFIPTNTAILYQYTTGEGFDGILCHLFSDYVAPISDGSQGTNITGITGTSVNLMLALDVDNGKVYAGYNGTWLNSGNPAGNTGEIATRTFSPTDVVAGHTSWNGTNDQSQYYNFGQRGFLYTPPSGFVALNTFNLPTPTIGATASTQANRYFDATLYTGNNTGQTITNANTLRPDFLWIKVRSNTYDHTLADSVRGVSAFLASNTTAAEGTNSELTSFNSNGFTLGATGSMARNVSGQNYVAWQWNANNGTNITNTAGSITSTVSANTSSGFSIVTYTGTGANATVGHGLGVAPRMVIVKRRSGADGWPVFTTMTSDGYLFLNSTSGKATGGAATLFGNGSTTVSPTSTVFSIATDSSLNGSGSTYVAYCFSEVAGYSRFGSYTGNGSADGPFIYTGFRPKFLIIKRTDSTGFWYTTDSARDTYNPESLWLLPNASNAETSFVQEDFLSNGFKLRNTNVDWNASGGTYIYMAFAESPFKYANAR
jgi:hypothetical protein